jgi:hypothetical protein
LNRGRRGHVNRFSTQRPSSRQAAEMSRYEFAVTGGQPGFYMMSNVSTSGHPTDLVMYAMRCYTFIQQHNSALDRPGYIADTFGVESTHAVVDQKIYDWYLRNISLRLIDRKSASGFLLIKGWQ